jgi:hypothetical protein
MIINPQQIITDFCLALYKQYKIQLHQNSIQHQFIAPPHSGLRLPKGQCACYVFSLTGNSNPPAGPNKVLKVGRIGPNSATRFISQHYNPDSAGSNLAGAIANNRLLWDYIGLAGPLTDYGQWINSKTDRDHFFLNAQNNNLLPFLEVYLKAICGPVFEGSMKKLNNKSNLFSNNSSY